MSYNDIIRPQEFCKLYESDLPSAEMMEVQQNEADKADEQPKPADKSATRDELAAVRDTVQLLRILHAISRSTTQAFGEEGTENHDCCRANGHMSTTDRWLPNTSRGLPDFMATTYRTQMSPVKTTWRRQLST